MRSLRYDEADRAAMPEVRRDGESLMPGLRETLEAATPGPWKWNSGGYYDSGHRIVNLGSAENPTKYPVLDCAELGDPDAADAGLIALAPELAAWGLDVFERHAHLLDDDLLNRWQKITGGE